MSRRYHFNKYISYSEPSPGFDKLRVRVKLENYVRELEVDLYVYSFDLLKCSRKLIDKILPFCIHINEIIVSSNAVFQISMRYILVGCYIIVHGNLIEFIQDHQNCLCKPKCFNIDQFDEFLEMFSKTLFYKRPEFIEVAIKD